MTQHDELLARLDRNKHDERHNNTAETMYWFRQWKLYAEDAAAAIREQAEEITRLRKDPDDVLSDHPGCVYCMEAGTPVKLGEVCPKCGDRLPTRRQVYTDKLLEAERAAHDTTERYGQKAICVTIWKITNDA